MRVTAPKELQEIILLTGLGSKNSMGFGYVQEEEVLIYEKAQG
ncbi:MAG: hypothetical protein EAZ55_09130 [Cytophagales bacterium]|nr:MAG: hypothetical protein EAZ55_09130 [Cytophagales bacterium]